MKKLAVALSVILVILVIETFPCYSQVIIGCVDKKSGQLRIVTSTTPCKPSENRISWNQAGPQGPQGVPGPAGKDGLPGPPGVGNLGVYDGSGLFLGYFIRTIPEASYEIFNPEIQAFLQVVFKYPPSLLGFAPNGGFYYITEDCSGEPYFSINVSSFFQELFNYPFLSDTYYIFNSTSPVVSMQDLKAWMPANMVCYTFTPPPPPPYPEGPYAAFPIKQLDKAHIPLMNITLQYPIIIKPMQ